jgi:hypothetical protein
MLWVSRSCGEAGDQTVSGEVQANAWNDMFKAKVAGQACGLPSVRCGNV